MNQKRTVAVIRYFFHISYNGHAYHGWQRQNNVYSIQECIEEKLSQILGEKIVIIGCGRTDAGVHARQYYFHIDTKKTINEDHLFIINKNLPSDIVVHEIIPFLENHHAQFDAANRTYEYHIHNKKNPFIDILSTYYPLEGIDLAKIDLCLAALTTHDDFRSFCKTPDKHNNTICDVSLATCVYNQEDDKMIFTFRSNRFLRGMIRVLVQALLDVGHSRMSVNDFVGKLKNPENPDHIKYAFPQGLYLTQVNYPFLKDHESNN